METAIIGLLFVASVAAIIGRFLPGRKSSSCSSGGCGSDGLKKGC